MTMVNNKTKELSFEESLAAVKSESPAYTNTNDPLTLTGALGLGAAQSLNDTVLGGGGYLTGLAGRGIEKISPWSGEVLNDYERNALYKLPIPLDEIQQIDRYEDSWLTSGAKSMLEANNYIGDTLSGLENDLLGENPTDTAKMFRGAGTSLGSAALGAAFGVNPLSRALWSGLSEAVTEAGGFLGDAYRKGQYDDGALGATTNVFASNAVVNPALDYLTGPLGTIADKAGTPLGRVALGALMSPVNEVLQEPTQDIIQEAAQRSLENGTGYVSELAQGFKNDWADRAKELAPEVAGSTLITSAILSPLHLKAARANIKHENDLKKFDALVKDRDDTLERLKNINPANFEEIQKEQIVTQNI